MYSKQKTFPWILIKSKFEIQVYLDKFLMNKYRKYKVNKIKKESNISEEEYIIVHKPLPKEAFEIESLFDEDDY